MTCSTLGSSCRISSPTISGPSEVRFSYVMGMHSLRPITVLIIWRRPTVREPTMIEACSACIVPTTSSAPSG
ncbi:hypothetical protein D3C86_1922490 [compost metagenome]